MISYCINTKILVVRSNFAGLKMLFIFVNRPIHSKALVIGIIPLDGRIMI
jgi:hypothetical protein